jgi:hypothetical protein
MPAQAESRVKNDPNPDIEKVDVADHGDLERFFLEAELLVLQMISLSRIEKEHPRRGMVIPQVLSKRPPWLCFSSAVSVSGSPVWT